MSFLDRLRNLISGPPHVTDGGDPEAAATLREEYGTPDEGEADVRQIAGTGQVGTEGELLSGLGARSSFGAAEAAEAAEEDLDTEEAPPDPAP